MKNNYKLEPHFSKFFRSFHYHLVLTSKQKHDANGIKYFYTVAEIVNAGLNDELSYLLRAGLEEGAKYIKVEIENE